ncbi:MAG: sulfotransferase family 2 domain-containing protein [Rubrobacter sp.]
MRSREKYIVHDGREFIYFVTQKVACTSIKTALLPLFGMDVADFERTRPDGTQKLRVHKLFDASEYQIGKEQLVADLDGRYQGYFKFAFVRNPWDRLLSCYFNKFARANAPGLKAPANIDVELYAGMPFAEFVESVSAIPDRKANLHFRSQHTAICDPGGRPMASFVGRFGDLAADFKDEW